MNRRLQLIYQMLPKKGVGIVDVGTDHGQIPIQLAMNHYSGNLYASDIVPGPLSAAVAAAERQNLNEKIHFLLCDGLDLCPPDEIDCILIAGMGGDTICRILDHAEWLFSNSYTLVLQPMTRAEVLRYWLVHNEYRIIQEAIVSEDSHIYQIIYAVPGKSSRMKDYEYLIGSDHVARLGDPRSFLVDQQVHLLHKKLDGLYSSSESNTETARFYQSILSQMEAL